MSDLITFRPEPEQYSYTFGGRAPVARIRPGDLLEVYTEDCFGGAVRSVAERLVGVFAGSLCCTLYAVRPDLVVFATYYPAVLLATLIGGWWAGVW